MRSSVFSLASVETEAFCRRRVVSRRSHVALWVLMLVAILTFDRRVAPSGKAVCLLAPRRGRQVLLFGALALFVCLVAGAAPVPALASVALLIVFSVRTLSGRLGELQQGGRLRRRVPDGRHLYVHSVASVQPGAGSELMRELVMEADEKGWSLLLDADNEALARYYTEFGFVAQHPEDISRPGRVRMYRPISERVLTT